MTTHVLVTGGAGFVGSHLVDGLVERDYQVSVMDNLSSQVHTSKPPYLNEAVNYIWEDVRDRSVLRDVLKDVDVVSHQAAAVGVGQSMYEIERYVNTNALGTATILDVLVNNDISLDKFVVASSMSIYGEGEYVCSECNRVQHPGVRSASKMEKQNWDHTCVDCSGELDPQPTTEEKPLDSTSVYAITKKDQEQLVRTVCRAYDIDSVALRYFNIYGSRQALENPYTGECAIFSSRIKNGKPPLVFEDGKQKRDFVHVDDVVGANIAAIESSVDDIAFNVGTGEPISIEKVAEVLIDQYGATDLEPKITNDYREGDIRHCYADISPIKDKLDWEPKISFEDGVQELISWAEDKDVDDNFDQARSELEDKGLLLDDPSES